MATPTSVTRHNAGSLTLLIATFAGTLDDGDTYASGLDSNVIGFWANATDDASTQTNTGVDVSNSSGTFTFSLGEDNRAVMLYILATI